MHNTKWTLSLVLILTLALILAACGGDPEPAAPEATQAPAVQSTTAPAVQPTTAPTNTPLPPTDLPEPTAAPVADFDLDNLADAGDLSSYRSTMRLAISGTSEGQPVEQSIDLIVEYVADPPAQHILMSGASLEGETGGEALEMYQVDNMSYIRLGEEWMSMPATEDIVSDTALINPDDIVGDTCGWKSEGTKAYQGVNAYYYTLDQDEMKGCMSAEDLAEMGDIREVNGELYVAVDGHYIVFMNILFEGDNMTANMGTEDTVLDEGRMEITYGLSDVNQPFVIEVPEEATTAGSLPEDLPVPADATDTSNMFGMITFNSPSTTQVVAEFYQAEMPANGWTETSFQDFDGMYMIDYTKDTRTASLMISADDETGLTSVIITIADSTETGG